MTVVNLLESKMTVVNNKFDHGQKICKEALCKSQFRKEP